MHEHSLASRQHLYRSGTDVVGTKEAAELLHVSVATVQKMVERGEVEAWRTEGGHRRIPLRSILELTRSRTNVAPRLDGHCRSCWQSSTSARPGRWGDSCTTGARR